MTQTFQPTITGVVIMVPEAKAITPWAHITLLAPFGLDHGPTPGEIAALEEFWAEEMPFDFDLTQVCTFPSGLQYLSPEPASAFSRLLAGDDVEAALRHANRMAGRNAAFRGATGLADHLRGELVRP